MTIDQVSFIVPVVCYRRLLTLASHETNLEMDGRTPLNQLAEFGVKLHRERGRGDLSDTSLSGGLVLA